MTALATAGAGFLLAVLWFDLMFDLQILGRDRGDGHARRDPEDAVASIAAYYRRVTTDAAPMNYLVAVAMLVVLAAIVAELAGDEVPAATAWASLALVVPAIAIALLHTVPTATRLGARRDGAARQAALARSILRDHLACFALVAALLAVQLAQAL
ncbi:MAG TPA: hypothetical protein VFY99_07250 [Solirubrobacterales bacterium]